MQLVERDCFPRPSVFLPPEIQPSSELLSRFLPREVKTAAQRCPGIYCFVGTGGGLPEYEPELSAVRQSIGHLTGVCLESSMTKESNIQIKSGRLNKPNEILVMVPRTGRLTLVGRKLYNVLLHHSQLKLQTLRGKSFEATDYFEAPLRQLLDPVGTGDSDYRALAKKYLVEMQDVTMEWDSPESTAGSEWKRLKLLSEVDFVRKSGELWVRWALPPTLIQGIADPQRWTSLELSVMARLTTYSAVALYEICARYKNNPSGVTGRKPTDWWIDALSNSPPPIDSQTGEKKRREWRKIKNEFVSVAIDQINENTDLEIQLLEFKQGRAVSEVQFSVRKKVTRVEVIDLSTPINTPLLLRAERAGLTAQEFETLALRHTDVELEEGLVKLEHRKAAIGLEEVRSAAGYLRHLLDKRVSQQADTADSPQQGRAVAATIAVSRDEGADWLQAKRDEVANAIAQLAPDKQRKLLQQVTDSLRHRGLLTPSVARRASQGDWSATGFLRNEMVQLFAQQHLGPLWDKPPEVIEGEVIPVENALAEQGA